MRGGLGLRALLRRSKPAQIIDPPGYRLPARFTPTPPPPPPGPDLAPHGKPRVRLVLADGTEADLGADVELEERAAYLVRSMLPPPPPPPKSSG